MTDDRSPVQLARAIIRDQKALKDAISRLDRAERDRARAERDLEGLLKKWKAVRDGQGPFYIQGTSDLVIVSPEGEVEELSLVTMPRMERAQ